MRNVNVEIKARCRSVDAIRAHLNCVGAASHGIDHQIDTYFRTQNGRLKLRQGLIENNLIYYSRADGSGPKRSDVRRYDTTDSAGELMEVLSAAFDVEAVVDKQREIYFISNVKIHLDVVKELGSFVEIEAIDQDGTHTFSQLEQQCWSLIRLFHIAEHDFVNISYGDMVRQRRNHRPALPHWPVDLKRAS